MGFRVQVCTPYHFAEVIVALTVKEILEEQVAMKLAKAT
jgi:hypothetical protein